MVALVFDIEVPDDGEDHSTDEIYPQVEHGIMKTDIQITAQSKVLAVDGHFGDIFQQGRSVATGGIQHDGADVIYDGIFLHV